MGTKGNSVWAATLLSLGLVGDAAAGPKLLAPGFTPPKMVAVLPLANESPDSGAPESARFLFHEAIEKKGYAVLALDKTDAALRGRFAIGDDGQLKDADPLKLGRELGVDAVVYGTILKFKSVNVGVYQHKTVELSFRMVDTRTGQVLWAEQRKAGDKNLVTSVKNASQAANVAAGLFSGLKQKYFKTPLSEELSEETQKAVRWCAATLPRPSGKSGDTTTTTKSSSYSRSETTTTEEE